MGAVLLALVAGCAQVETFLDDLTPGPTPGAAEAAVVVATEGAEVVAEALTPDTVPLTAALSSADAPRMRWDHVDGSDAWTRAAFVALDGPAKGLLDLVPGDIASWCPAYPDADRVGRAAFWTGLLSTLSLHESTYRPRVSGDSGLSIGLLQIRTGTAEQYGCDVRTRDGLRVGSENVACAMRIATRNVLRDGVVSAGRGGFARDWGPFVQARKREDMRAWISRQAYCAA
ncbi:MAG: lytic transglycosylase [Paracoccaceae bacterium]